MPVFATKPLSINRGTPSTSVNRLATRPATRPAVTNTPSHEQHLLLAPAIPPASAGLSRPSALPSNSREMIGATEQPTPQSRVAPPRPTVPPSKLKQTSAVHQEQAASTRRPDGTSAPPNNSKQAAGPALMHQVQAHRPPRPTSRPNDKSGHQTQAKHNAGGSGAHRKSGGVNLPEVMQLEFSEDEVDDPSRASLNKHRQRARKRPAKKVSDNADEDDGSDDGKNNSVAACRLGFYKGKTLELLQKAIIFMRIYLLTCNGFPSTAKLLKNAKKFFKAACQLLLGSSWRSTFSTLSKASGWSLMLLLDKMPPFTKGMSRLVCTYSSSCRRRLTIALDSPSELGCPR